MSFPAVPQLESSDSDDSFDPFGGNAVERVISTSEVQREVWLADGLGTEASLAFNESVSLSLIGTLDEAALQAALTELVSRHASLRSTFSPDGMNMLISAPSAFNLEVMECRGLEPAERRAALDQVRRQSVTTPFHLKHGPVFRATLVRLPDMHAMLVLSAHHIVCDGWSWGVVCQDLGELYTEQVGAGPKPGPQNDYADYLRWEAVEAHGPEREAHQHYWLGRFRGSLPVLDLPTDRPRAPQRTFAAERIDWILPAELVRQAQSTGARMGLSLFATLFSTCATLLHHLTGQDDIVIGVPSAGQAASGLAALVGHCVNLLPVRVDVDTDEPFEQFAKRASGQLLDAFEHQSLTYGALLRQLSVQRDPSRLPLVSVMFNLDPVVEDEMRHFSELQVRLESVPRAYENFEFFLNLVRLADGRLRVECQYNTDLFDAQTMARWLRCFETLLSGTAEHPSSSIGKIGWVDALDIQAMRELQPRLVALPEPPTMHDAIVRQCRAMPDRVALRADQQQLSYRQLDEQSTQLARALRARGIGRGDHVGLCLNRSAEMVVALLAVLKSGAAYVPLDPGFPAARLAFYAEDANLALLLTESTQDAAPRNWRADSASRILELDSNDSWRRESSEPLAPSAADAQGDDVAYMIYTSGSTGQPKGVCLPHRAVANFLASMHTEPGLNPDDRLAAVTTLSFDIAVLELLLPLRVGACVVLVPRDTARDGRALSSLLDAEQVNVMQATPSLYRMLVEAGWQGGANFKVLIGGEGLPRDLAHALLARSAEVWNMYGPTETTVWSTTWRVESDAIAARGMSIGRPIANTSVWVLDGAGQACPVGVPGELVIGGYGVAAGYHERNDLTLDRFVADTFSSDEGARIYRTGDRGRWRNDGLLEHLGRLDFQVKLRGFRIELGEIEAACNAFPGVANSVALVREDAPGDLRLVAYLVPAGAQVVDERALRDFVRSRLPDYMVPQLLVQLESLPQLPNGKIDRKALPRPKTGPATAAEGPSSWVGPRTDIERLVLGAMESVLKLPGLGIHDDFFAMGGHSLLAARLAALLSTTCSQSVPLSRIFQSPTAEGLAKALASEASGPLLERTHFLHDPARDAAPLTPMQERVRLVQTIEPDSLVYNTPSGHVLTGPIDLKAFSRAFLKMVKRQPALRTFIARAGAGEHVQQVLPMDALAWADWPQVDLSAEPRALQSASLMSAIRAIADRPIDIYRAPLFRCAMYKLSDDEHVFLFMPHHLIWDGWSFDVLYREMSALYAAELEGQACALPVPALTHLDHAAGFNAWLAGPQAEQQKQRWRERFASLQQPVPLPTNRPRRQGMVADGATTGFVVDADLTKRVRALARTLGVTVSMLTMTVYSAMLGAVAGASTLVLGIPVRGRGMADLEHTTGFFINLLPLPVQLDVDASLKMAVDALRGELTFALSHQDVPFPVLAALPEINAKATAAGVYQAAFSFQDARERPPGWGPLKHTRLIVSQKGVTEETGLWLVELETQIEGSLTYNSEVFDAPTAIALGRWYLTLLDRATKQPETTLGELVRTPDSADAALLMALGGTPSRQYPVAAPAPSSRATTTADRFTSHELRLARLWARLLNIELDQIQATDNFFDLGGDSLMAMRAVEAGMAEFGVLINGRRYIYETLSQIAASTFADAQSTEPAPDDSGLGFPAPSTSRGGLLGRLFGGNSRRGGS